MSNFENFHARAKALNLHGLLAHWAEAAAAGWVEARIGWEERERGRRSLERRLSSAHCRACRREACSTTRSPLLMSRLRP